MPLDVFPYQEDGAGAMSMAERFGLWDEMGVGKTAQAIRALDLIEARRVLIVCPAAVREVWAGEFRKFARIPRKILKGVKVDDLNLWLRGRADVLLLSYEMATKWARRIEGELIEAIVFDEAHYLKSAHSQRTRALLGSRCDGKDGLARWSARCWFLSGTPMPNDPIDIWPWLRFVGGTTLSLQPFTARYFRSRATQYGSVQTPRPEMVGELRSAIQAHSLRRTKAEVGLKLPPIWLTTQTVDGDTAEIRALLREHPGMERAVIEAVEKGGLSFLDAQHIATLRRLVGEAKAPAFAELLVEELNNGLEKVVLFGVHKKALSIVEDRLQARGFTTVKVTGETSDQDRQRAVVQFQNDSGTRVFVGNVRAAGTGLTLTAAADIIMLESSWSPADNAQALMRVHRIGQERQVRGRFISLANSIDDHVTAVVARKTAAIAAVEEAA